MFECPVDRQIDRIANRLGSRDLIERLGVNYSRRGSPHRSRQISARDLLSSEYSLQIIVCLRRRTPSFQCVGQSCEAVCQAIFRGLLHCLRVGKARSRSVFLPYRTQQSVISLLYLVNDAAMCVVECEIGREKLRLCRTDPTGSGAEVEDGVVKIEPDLKVLDRLREEFISKQNIRAACLRESSRRHRGIQLTACNA